MKTKSLTSPHIDFANYPVAPDLEMTLRIILGRGIFERHSFAKFMSHVAGRNTAIEVGAHVGSWTLGFSKLFEHVVGFEPQPTNRQYLEKNIARAKADNIYISPYAVVGKLSQEFAISANGSTRNSGMTHLIPAHQGDHGALPVTTTTLDDFYQATAALQARKIDALKIDVEGMELNVLQGGEMVIHEHKPVILLEVNINCQRYGIRAEEIFDYMNDIGYRQKDQSRNDYTFAPKQP